MSDQVPHDERLRELYRELPADEPRAGIDAAILAAARRRGARDSRASLLARIRWAVPLAAAAGVVLTFALMRLAPEQRLDGFEESAGAPAVERREVASPEAAPAAAPKADDANPNVACLADEDLDPAKAEAKARAQLEADAASRAAIAKESLRWPFGLEPWLDAAQACRRLAAAASAPCEFRGDVAVVVFPRPVDADAGLHRGRPVAQVTLTRRQGRLAQAEFSFANASVRQLFVSPDPAP